MVNSYIRTPEDEQTIENFGQTPYYIMARKEDQNLIDEIDYAIDCMNVETPNWRTDLYNKYEHGHVELNPEAFNVAATVRENAEILRPLVEKKEQSLIVKCDREDCVAVGDAGRFSQIVINIVSKETSGGENMNHELLTLFASYMEKQEVLSKLTESEKLHGYNYSEIHTIDAVGKIGEPNVTAISEYMHMTRGAISKITKKLQRDGLLSTYMKPDNQQKIFFSLTEKGKILYEEHRQRHELWLKRDDDFLKKYDKEYLNQLQNFMSDFNEYLEEKINELGGKEDVN